MMKKSTMVGLKTLLATSVCALGINSASAVVPPADWNAPEASQVDKLVILPAQTNVAFQIKKILADKYYTANPKSKSAYQAAERQYFFYGARGFEPTWLSQNEQGDWEFSGSAARIIKVFESANEYGLRPEDYLTDSVNLDAALQSNDPEAIAAAELAFTQVTLKYANHAMGGRVNPLEVNSSITAKPQRADIKDIVKLATSDTPDQILLSMHPQHPEFKRLREQLLIRINGQVKELITIPSCLCRLGL